MESIKDPIIQLEEKKRQLEKRIGILKYQKRVTERKAASRKLWLTGFAVHEAIDTGQIGEAFIHELLNRYIVNTRDQEFLTLCPLDPIEGS